MIDVVFLLLIYFMYLPIKQEADMSVMLPVQTPPEPGVTVVLPSEQKVRIMPDGSISLNDSLIATATDIENARPLTALAKNLRRLNNSATNAGINMIVTIIPDGDAPHQASMSVLDACAAANIRQVSFSDAI
jgi:Biopolymer transport protein